MSELLNVSPNPHIRDKNSTSSIMFDVILALIPASAFGVYNFGIRALKVILVSIFCAVLSEHFFQVITKKKSTVNDFSAVVTGLLLALNLPHDIPYWMVVIGSVFCYCSCKTVIWRFRSEFYESCVGS